MRRRSTWRRFSGADNKATQHIAEEIISATPVTTTDEDSGLPALQYVRKIELGAKPSLGLYDSAMAAVRMGRG